MAKEKSLGNAAYITSKSAAPFRYAGESLHKAFAPLRESAEKALSAIPLLGPILAVIVSKILGFAEGVAGLGIAAVGAPATIASLLSERSKELNDEAERSKKNASLEKAKTKKLDDSAKKIEETGKNLEAKADEIAKNANQEKAENLENQKEIINNTEGNLNKELEKDVNNISKQDGSIKEGQPQIIPKVHTGISIFKKDPKDVYGREEGEPQLQPEKEAKQAQSGMHRAIALFSDAQKKVNDIHETIVNSKEENVSKIGVDYGELAEALYTQVLDHDMRRHRLEIKDQPGRLEVLICNTQNKNNSIDKLLKPTDSQKNKLVAELQKLDKAELLKVTSGMDAIAFRKYRNAVIQDITKSFTDEKTKTFARPNRDTSVLPDRSSKNNIAKNQKDEHEEKNKDAIKRLNSMVVL